MTELSKPQSRGGGHTQRYVYTASDSICSDFYSLVDRLVICDVNSEILERKCKWK